MENKEKWIAARGTAKGAITKIYNFCKNQVELDDASLELLQVKLQHLQSNFADYKELNIKLTALCDEPIATKRESISTFQDYEDKYLIALSLLQKTIKNKLNLSPSPPPERNSAVCAKLPKIEIKTFNGKDGEYYPFINLYNSLIHNDKSLSKLQKMYYLRMYLSGEPLDLIKNLNLDDDNYEQALKLLSNRYDNVNKTISQHVNCILDINPVTRCTAESLRSFIAQVKQSLSALESLKQPVHHWDALLVPMLTRKIDQYTVRSYYLEQGNSKDFPHDVNDFLTFLEKKALALEATASSDRKYGGTGSSAGGPARASQRASLLTSKETCEFCHSFDHKVHKCPKFKTATINQKLKFIEEAKRCKLCLNQHTNKCYFRFKCAKCKGKHNTLLHNDADDVMTSEGAASAPQVSLLNSDGNNSKQVLLPTVSVKLFTKDGSDLHVRAVLDSGSEVSMITQEIADKIDCTMLNKSHMVVGVCEGSNNINAVAEFDIHASKNSFSMPVSCSVVNKIHIASSTN